MYAGLDWSGTPHPQEQGVGIDVYIPCIVHVEDIDATDTYMTDWRKQLGRSITYEFHGHQSRPEVLEQAIEYVLANGRVVAVLLDKQEITEQMGPQVFDHPATLPPATGRIVLDQILEVGPLRRIWLDEDIASDRRKAFNTEIKRKARALGQESPDLKHYPSDKSNMIQLADMIAYVLQRDAKNLLETEELCRLVRQLWRQTGNRIWWGSEDDLRPYL